MIPPQRYFPWKVASKFFFGHLIFVLMTLIVTGFSLRYFAYTNFLSATDLHRALARFDSYLTSLFLTVLGVAAAYLAVSTRSYAKPLGRLIQRARELRRSDARIEEDVMDPDALHEEPGEWYDLERALNRIHKDLRIKTDALIREREELAALINAVTDAIFAIDKDGEPLFFNSQFALFFRVAKSGQKPLSLSETFRVQDILLGYREVLKTGVPKTVQALVHTAHYQLPRHFSVSIAPLNAGEGLPVYGALGIFHDVTELKQAEQIRIEFVGNASHELRTPLTSLKGYVETLRGDMRDQRFESVGMFVDVIAKNVDRLIALVNDLLDLSALESGADLQRTQVSVQEVTESALKQLETKRYAKRQAIEVSYGVESVFADPRRVEQVLVNLIHNAIKYIPEGSRIQVGWGTAQNSVVLKVKDDGPGVPLEHQARLFERFYRVDSGRSRDQGGTGLGLSIVKHIMLKHGGSIRLVSRPDNGAEFICTFPD